MNASVAAHVAASAKQPGRVARRLAAWPGLLATPVFAAMAVATYLTGATAMPMMGDADASLLTRMDTMYLLMSAIHLAPWLRLLAHRQALRHAK